MKLLKEFINPDAVQLTATQKAILATIAIAASPEVAYENCNGVQSFLIARNGLRILGLIRIGANTLHLTDAGQNALVTNDLIDETGQPTEEGQKLVDAMQKEKEIQNNESFNLISGFLT